MLLRSFLVYRFKYYLSIDLLLPSCKVPGRENSIEINRIKLQLQVIIISVIVCSLFVKKLKSSTF